MALSKRIVQRIVKRSIRHTSWARKATQETRRYGGKHKAERDKRPSHSFKLGKGKRLLLFRQSSVLLPLCNHHITAHAIMLSAARMPNVLYASRRLDFYGVIDAYLGFGLFHSDTIKYRYVGGEFTQRMT